MKYEAVIFDLDGTLLNTLEDLTDAVNAALRKNSMRDHTLEEIRGFVGNGIGKLMERAIPGGRENPVFEKAFEDFKMYYGKHCRDKTVPYPGVMDMLCNLKEKKIKMAIVSNKADFAVKELREVYFSGLIEIAAGEKEGIRRKPAPDMVHYVLQEMDCPVEKAIYVGDSDVDIMTAENSGMECISVSWGFREKGFLLKHGARKVIDTPNEIIKILS